jgi:hypothetical protein
MAPATVFYIVEVLALFFFAIAIWLWWDIANLRAENLATGNASKKRNDKKIAAIVFSFAALLAFLVGMFLKPKCVVAAARVQATPALAWSPMNPPPGIIGGFVTPSSSSW